jgi:hypothetical protein
MSRCDCAECRARATPDEVMERVRVAFLSRGRAKGEGWYFDNLAASLLMNDIARILAGTPPVPTGGTA